MLLLLDSDFAIRSGTGTDSFTNRTNHDVRTCTVCVETGMARKLKVGGICSAQATAVDYGHDAERPASVPSQLTPQHQTGTLDWEAGAGSCAWELICGSRRRRVRTRAVTGLCRSQLA